MVKAIERPALSKGERTAIRIMDTAERLFARAGYAGTSLREIAAEAGLREPGLYNHFPSKEALYAAVLERAMQPMEARIAEVLDGTVTPAKVMNLPIEMLRLHAEHPHMAALFYQAIQALHEGPTDAAAPASGGGAGPWAAKWMERLFAMGRAANRQVMPGDDDTVLLQGIAMFNLVSGYFLAAPLLQDMTGTDPLSPEALARQRTLIERVMRTFLIG